MARKHAAIRWRAGYHRRTRIPIPSTDPEQTASWLDSEEGVYPPEARDVLIDYTLNYAPQQPPGYWLRNFGQIESEALNPAFEQLWNGTLDAQAAMDQAAETAAPLLEGRW